MQLPQKDANTLGSDHRRPKIEQVHTMSKPETRIQQRNRAAILSAGLDIFSQFGLRGSTLDQIADAAGLSKPNLLYYFKSKDAIYTALLERLLETWLDPLQKMDANGDPIKEILGYVHRKLAMSKDYPRESRLFANEILQGAPHIADHLSQDLRQLVDEKAVVLKTWEAAGKIAPIDPHHLVFSIWAMTQHYADFDVQVRAVLGDKDPFEDAMAYLDTLFRRMLTPPNS
ncbi:TetR/AcrR family transcriptional regulator [Yoonia maritima]|uniref:TetR/AcrR family transcriptional regulator n=2 Tax=Yoonia maritima TaxID=1435347 RepID=A0A2T0VZA2_9RHOB|nr:TetR/AcrR family transcriptional regulator [Yoonia maritima]